MGGLGGHATVTLDVFGDALVAEATAEAEHLIAEAESAALDRVSAAEKDAEATVATARREGRSTAERETALDRASARRKAHEMVLDAQRRAFELLRQSSIDALNHSDGLSSLLDRAESLARSQLGEGTRIEPDPDSGGFVATVAGRRMDLRTPALIDQAMGELGSELKELWE